ncbi:hypothetical protein PENTCL1PPCAC_22262, partial [Pristionchus entomophagus]
LPLLLLHRRSLDLLLETLFFLPSNHKSFPRPLQFLPSPLLMQEDDRSIRRFPPPVSLPPLLIPMLRLLMRQLSERLRRDPLTRISDINRSIDSISNESLPLIHSIQYE